MPISPSIGRETRALTIELGQFAWGSYLISRDLFFSLISSDGRFGVEWYGPAQVSRQFCLCQAIPFPPMHSLNTHFSNRVGVDPSQKATIEAAFQFFHRRYLQPISLLTLSPETSELYRQWWSSYSAIHFDHPFDHIFGLLMIPKVDSHSRSPTPVVRPSRMEYSKP